MGQVIFSRLDTTFQVETPEHIAFSFQLAGPARRAGAYVIDLIARALFGVLLLFAFVFAGFTNPLAEDGGGVETGLALVIFFFMEWGYFVLCELLMNGRSLGKKALRLRVIRSAGTPISFADSLLRNLLRAADILPNAYALGLCTMCVDHKFRRLGDLVSGTVVIFEPKSRVAPYSSTDPLQNFPDLPAILSLSTDERSVLSLFLRRRPALSEARARELAMLLAPKFSHRYGVTFQDPIAFLRAIHSRGANS